MKSVKKITRVAWYRGGRLSYSTVWNVPTLLVSLVPLAYQLTDNITHVIFVTIVTDSHDPDTPDVSARFRDAVFYRINSRVEPASRNLHPDRNRHDARGREH